MAAADHRCAHQWDLLQDASNHHAVQTVVKTVVKTAAMTDEMIVMAIDVMNDVMIDVMIAETTAVVSPINAINVTRVTNAMVAVDLPINATTAAAMFAAESSVLHQLHSRNRSNQLPQLRNLSRNRNNRQLLNHHKVAATAVHAVMAKVKADATDNRAAIATAIPTIHADHVLQETKFRSS